MTAHVETLGARAREAITVIDQVLSILSSLGIEESERSLVAIPLLLASMDNASVVAYLLATKPERTWVSALSLHRTQVDYLLRGAYFARSASKKELAAFRRSGRMPSRSDIDTGKKRQIHARELAEEVSRELGLGDSLVKTVVGHWGPLSGIVHGGKELLGIYLMNDRIGDTSIDFADLMPVLGNSVALVQIGLAMLMSLSSLPQEQVSDIVKPVFGAAQRYFE